MTTLVLTSSWPRSRDPSAGTFVRSDAKALVRAGERVVVAAPSGAGVAADLEGGTVVDVPCGGLFGTPGAALRAEANPLRLLGLASFGLAISALVRRLRPTRVVAHWMTPCGAIAMLAFDGPIEVIAHGADVRLLEGLAMHSLLPTHGWLGDRLRARRDRVTLRAVSEGLATRLGALGAYVHRIAPCALDDELLEEARRAPHRFREERPIRVVAARLIRKKGLARAVDRASDLGGTLVWVGDGPMRAELRAMGRRRGVRMVETGAVEHAMALRMIAGADELIAPLAEGEGAPTAVREARALGVPVVELSS